MGLFSKKDTFSSGITAWDEECQRKTPTDRSPKDERKVDTSEWDKWDD